MNKIVARVKDSERIEYILLASVVVLSFLVRLYKIDSPIADWHSWRQVDTASVARYYVDHGIDLLHPRYYDISSVQTGYFNPEGLRFVEFPIYNYFHAISYQLLPIISFDIWGRLISIFASLITLLTIYLIGKKTGNKWIGLAGAFFFGFIPFNIYYSRVILPEPMATMFAIVAVYLYLKYDSTENNSYLYLSALTFSLSLLIKPYTVFYGLPIAYLLLKKYSVKQILTHIPLLLAMDIVLVPFFAWRAWIGHGNFFVGIPHYKWVFNGDGIRFRPAFWRWIFNERLGHLILGTWGLVPFVLGVLKSKKLSATTLMIVGMFMYVCVVATASVRHDYYQSVAIPAIALILAQGVVYLWNTNDFPRFASRVLVVFCTFMMLGMGWYQIKEYYKVNHPEFVSVGAMVDEIVPKDAKIIAPDNGNTVFLYYTKRQGWPILEESIYDAIEKGADYYVSVNKNDADTVNFKTKFTTVKEGPTFVILDLHKPISS
jgi:hypothetical protein